MRDRAITASFTAFQEKSSELGWEETQGQPCKRVCREGHVDRAVKHGGSEGANPSCVFWTCIKGIPSGEEEGLRHSSAIAAPHAELTGVKLPKVLGAGCCMEGGDRWFLLNTGDSY